MNARKPALAAALLVVGLGLVVARAHATPPAHRNGPIAFMRYRPQDNPLWSEIFVTNPDGRGAHRVTHPREGFQDDRPDWAPNGSRIIFQRYAPSHGRSTVWTVNADGTGGRQLSPTCPPGTSPPNPRCPNDSLPAFSPNGRRIAFSRWSRKTNGIVIADANLHHVRLVFGYKGINGGPDAGNVAWSPSGYQLAFTIHNDNGRRFKPVNGWAIFVVNTDGTGLHRITPWEKARPGDQESNRLDWSPDGQHILFRAGSGVGRGDGNLFTISPDGTDRRQLTHFHRAKVVRAGSFSPDGNWIVFATTVRATDRTRGLPDVFVMQTDGTHRGRLTRSGDWDGTADWGPAR